MFDPKCELLAAHFLPMQASKVLCDGLAQAIQDAAEAWMHDNDGLIRRELGKAPEYSPFERSKDRD